jgi:predicted nucleic acid-binding protein
VGGCSSINIKSRSQCVVACIWSITIFFSQAENYPILELFMSATSYVITSPPSVVCEPSRSTPHCRYLLDTCIVVDYVEQNVDIPRALLDECAISIITFMELLLPRKRSAITVYRLGEFLTSRSILVCDLNCFRVAITLRFKMKLTVTDAIIAATSVCNRLTLVTADKRLLSHPDVKSARLEDVIE